MRRLSKCVAITIAFLNQRPLVYSIRSRASVGVFVAIVFDLDFLGSEILEINTAKASEHRTG